MPVPHRVVKLPTCWKAVPGDCIDCPGQARAQRLEQIHQTLNRLGLKADTKVADAQAVEKWWNGE